MNPTDNNSPPNWTFFLPWRIRIIWRKCTFQTWRVLKVGRPDIKHSTSRYEMILSYLCGVYVWKKIRNCLLIWRVNYFTNDCRRLRFNFSFNIRTQFYSAPFCSINVTKNSCSRFGFIKSTRQFQTGKSACKPQCFAWNIFLEIQLNVTIQFCVGTFLAEERFHYVWEVCVTLEFVQIELIDNIEHHFIFQLLLFGVLGLRMNYIFFVKTTHNWWKSRHTTCHFIFD